MIDDRGRYQSNFEKLMVWQRAHALVIKIYQITRSFPKEEKYGITDQLRRSASSIPTNIAEGNEKKSRKEFIQFLFIAKGSLAETKYHLILAKDLNYIPQIKFDELLKEINEIGRLLNGLINSLSSITYHLSSKKSFTLLELTIVIGLLAILGAAVIALLNPWSQIGKANDAKRKHDLDVLRKVLEDYYNDHGCYPRPEQICYGGPAPTPLAGFSNICKAGFPNRTPLWQTCYICGTDPTSPSITPYLSQLPCDPQHAAKDYLYQVDSTTCTGNCSVAVDCTNMCPKSYIIYSKLNDTSDPVIAEVGCSGIGGCGTSNDHNYQYAVNSPNQLPQKPPCGRWYLNGAGDCNSYSDPSVCQTYKCYCTSTDCCTANPGAGGCIPP